MEKARYDIPVEPKAGKVGAISVFCFGVVSILAVFVAAYMWTNADVRLAGAIGVASIVIPVTVGYFVSEMVHQRAGAFWFVMTAALVTGAAGAWSLGENEAFQDRMDLIAPDSRPAPEPTTTPDAPTDEDSVDESAPADADS